MSGAIDFFC